MSFPWILLFETSSINSISDPSEYTDNSLFSLELYLPWILLELDLCREELRREWRLSFLYLLDFPSLTTELLLRRFLNRRRSMLSFNELPLERCSLDLSADSRGSFLILCTVSHEELILCTVSREELRGFVILCTVSWEELCGIERKSTRTGPNSSSLILEQALLESSESSENDVSSVLILTLELKCTKIIKGTACPIHTRRALNLILIENKWKILVSQVENWLFLLMEIIDRNL